MTPSPEQQHAATILIIDNDLGFLMWLGLSLASRGYLTIPATSCQNALRLVDELQPPTIDLVIIELRIAHSSAPPSKASRMLLRRGRHRPRSIASRKRRLVSASAAGLCSAMKPRTASSAR